MLSYINSFAGGALIGLAATILLLFLGRVAGVSGILYGAVTSPPNDRYWRWAFVCGLFAGGTLLSVFRPDLFVVETGRPFVIIIFAGLLVGFGSLLGSGCTSGHGVCGMSRFSIRSAAATIIFINTGFVTVALYNWLVSNR